MKKLLYFFIACSHLAAFGMQEEPNISENQSKSQVRYSTTMTQGDVMIDIDPQKPDLIIGPEGEVDYMSSLANGFIVTPEIIAEMGGDSMLNIMSTTHQKLYHGAPLDQRALILSRALMDKYAKRTPMSMFIRNILPSFWRAVSKVANISQYVVTAASPLVSSVNLLLSSMLGDDYTSEDEKNMNSITQSLNAASLLSFQIGTYVASSIYNYSSGLKDYYLNESYEKDYIKATMKINQNSEYYPYIPNRQKPGKVDGITVPQEYYGKCGPLVTETARQIMMSADNKELLTIKKEAEKSKSLLGAYRKGSACSIAGGLCRIAAGACAICNTVLTTTSLVLNDEELNRTFSATQIVLASLSMTLSGMANFFDKKSGFFSRSFLLYPIYKPALLGQMKDSSMEEENPQN